jgi:hypothetical protein
MLKAQNDAMGKKEEPVKENLQEIKRWQKLAGIIK